MLSKKDKEYLREEIKTAVIEALTVPIRIELRRDKETGQPLAIPKEVTEEVFLPSYIVQILPYHEQALRGMQETTDKQKVKIGDAINAVKAMAEILDGYKNSIMITAEIANQISKDEDNKRLLNG